MEGWLIWVLSGIVFVAIVVALVKVAMKSGAKMEMPKTTPYDVQDAPPSDDEA